MFDWKDEFSVGIKKFDDQHKKLLKVGDDLVMAMKNISKGIDEYDYVKKLLQKMYEYTQYHFKSEEELMEKNSFPGLNKHKKQHKLFIEKLDEIDVEELDLNQEEFIMNLLNFVADWVETHIARHDNKYAEYFADKDIG